MQKEPSDDAGHLRSPVSRPETFQNGTGRDSNGSCTVSRTPSDSLLTVRQPDPGTQLDVRGTKQREVTRKGVIPQEPANRVEISNRSLKLTWVPILVDTLTAGTERMASPSRRDSTTRATIALSVLSGRDRPRFHPRIQQPTLTQHL